MEKLLANKAKVLLIDDDPDTVSATQMLLQSRGFDVVTATTPEEGLSKLEQGKPHVVVLDVMMPHGIEGFQWLWDVRHHADAAVRQTPVIVASSIHQTTKLRFHEGDADETGDYLPVQGFFDKPVDPDQLAAKIQAVLSGAG